MSVKVDGSQARIHWLSNDHAGNRLTRNQAVLYEVDKFGQVTRDSAEGLTPAEAFEQRYPDKSTLKQDLIAKDIFVIDKKQGPNFDYDDGFREFCHDLYKKGRIPFDALYPGYQLPNTNAEALISYDRGTHLNILLNCLKQYFGLGIFFDTKDPVSWRFKQEEDIVEISDRLIKHRLCLYAAYTSRGKTKISIEVAVRLCQRGGIVLVTTPITDTKKSFEENINDYHFGFDRNLKVTYMDSIEFAKHSVAELRQRADDGELIFIVLTVQDLRYGENYIGKVDINTTALRAKYHALSGEITLWIRDERHEQYGGQVTSQRLANMTAEYELDLTATPYNVLDKYNWEQIVSRTLQWGLKYKEHTKLPIIRIDAISTPLSSVSSKIALMYSEEEGFDPRKLFVRNNGKFILRAELLDIRDKMYHDTSSKKKNPLSIVNDKELSDAATTCGFWVLPEGQDGDGAADYIPNLASLLNTNSKTYFTDSYTIEKECPKNKTIGEYIESLVKLHGRVIILTCGKFLTGTDIPVLGHIVLMAKMNNIANFEQLLGRMIREYPGKDEVKMYCFAPAMEIGLTMGRMAKMNAVALNGGTEYEMLECIPLTEYTIDGPYKINPDTILTEVQEFLKNCSKDKLPSASLESALAGVDLSGWEGLNTKKFKKSTPKTGVTEDNGAKIKTKLSIDPKTGKPRTKEELTTITQIANAIQSVMVEAKWIAYSIDNYDYSVVLSNPVLAKMFPEEIAAVNFTIESNILIREMVVKNLNEKQLAYKGLSPIEVYDDIFMNTEYKRQIGLVYVNFDMAKELIDKLPESKYNKEDITICVVNALSGTIPILLKEKFPKARIVCAEYFEYFKDHLIRLGFEVIDVRENNDGKLRIKDHNNMKFNVVIGNPPYQSTDQEGKRNDKAKNLWSKFVLKGLELIKKDGTISMIVPSTWLSPSADIGKGTTGIRFLDIFTAGQLEYVNVGDIGKHFPNIGLHFSHFMYTNTNTERYLTRVKTPTEEFDFDFRDVKYVPNTFSKLAISILNTVLYDDRKKFDFVSTNFKGMVSKLDGGCYDVFHTSAVNGIKKSSTKSVNHHNKKVIVSSSSVYAPYYDTGTVSCSVMTMSCVFDDRDDLAKIKTILSSKLYQYVVEHTIYGGWVSYEAIRRLPLLDITKFWTDEEIYEEFKLTPEEIREVETYTYLDGKHPKRVLS